MRLAVRATWAAAFTAVLLPLFLLARGADSISVTERRAAPLAPRVLRIWAGLALATLGLRLVQHGEPLRGPGVFVANHSSWIDIVALQRTAAPFLLAKSEVRRWPVIGLVARAIGTMFIERRSAFAREQEARLRDRLARGDRMAFFPEGTSTDGQCVLPFKSALFAAFSSPGGAEVDVQPVLIRYVVPPDLPRDFYAWWGDMDLLPHLADVLALSAGGVVEVHYLAALRPEAGRDRKSLARASELMVRERLSLW